MSDTSTAPGFQSTPPCGGDLFDTNVKEDEPYFNPRPLAGATLVLVSVILATSFQSTPPCGGDNGYE